MNVSLTSELEQLISDKIASGLYKSASEVIREALRLLVERDELLQLRKQRLRQLVAQGLDDLDIGHSREFDEVVLAEVKSAGRRRVDSGTGE